MASGAPDFYRPVKMYGYNGTTLRVIKTDSSGQLYAMLRALYGSTVKDIQCDGSGNLYIILRGAGGIDVAVDASGFLTTVLKGIDGGGALRTLLTDTSGRLIAQVKAIYDTTIKDVQCDENGNLTLNIKAQDLAQLVTRPTYGACKYAFSKPAIIPNGNTTLIEITGKGMIYSSFVYAKCAAISKNDKVKLSIDGVSLSEQSFAELKERGLDNITKGVIFLDVYENNPATAVSQTTDWENDMVVGSEYQFTSPLNNATEIKMGLKAWLFKVEEATAHKYYGKVNYTLYRKKTTDVAWTTVETYEYQTSGNTWEYWEKVLGTALEPATWQGKIKYNSLTWIDAGEYKGVIPPGGILHDEFWTDYHTESGSSANLSRYGVGLGSGITFEEEIKIEYIETYGRTPEVEETLYYTLVT